MFLVCPLVTNSPNTHQEAIYELGVCDNGLLLGINSVEIETSLVTLNRMADGLGATVRIARRMRVSAEGIEELPVDEASSIQCPPVYKDKPPTRSYPSSHLSQRTEPSGQPPSSPSFTNHANRKRIHKKDRRQIKREREIWLKSCAKQCPISVDSEELTSGAVGLDDGSGTTIYLAATPPVDDLPGLSHSPSPPSSTGSIHPDASACTRLSVAERVQDSNLHIRNSYGTVEMSQSASFGSNRSRSSDKPIPIEISAEEQAHHALRRHLRKEWKREKQKQKQLERARHMAHAHGSRQRRTRNGLPVYSVIPQDRYLEGLAALFGDVSLEETDIDDALLMDTVIEPEKPRCRSKEDHDTNKEASSTSRKRRGAAFSPTSTPLSGTLTPATAVNLVAPLAAVAQSAEIAISPARLAAAARRTKPTLAKTATEEGRYAVECVISMPVDPSCESSADEAGCSFERDSGIPAVGVEVSVETSKALNHGVGSNMTTVSAPRATPVESQKATRAKREQKPLQSFIDFETVWDELEMDL